MTLVDTTPIGINRVQIGNEAYYKISNSDAMRPFFMNVVSDANHWIFISSNGGLSLGRRNAEYALFPYYTDDKITESAEITGSKTIIQVHRKGEVQRWEPFSERYDGQYETTRNLYKSIYGNKILFEEINHSLQLAFTYSWSTSNTYGFVKHSSLKNLSEEPVELSVADGIQNILPYGVNSDLQNRVSNLVDAYKRNELVEDVGLGIYALSAIIVDKAEPSEALKTNVAWSTGLADPTYLLSSLQLDRFRKNLPLDQETDVKGEKGAYFVHSELMLDREQSRDWLIVADVNKDHADVARLINEIRNSEQLAERIKADIDRGTKRLIDIIAAADGLQSTSDHLRDTRHFANTLFNVMRGGIFDHNYRVERWDLVDYLSKANKKVYRKFKAKVEDLPEQFSLAELRDFAERNGDVALRRLCKEYMPLKFSRRHGDPSRPWNQFSINTHKPDGTKLLDYEGNWRDIFQNWEALALSYPDFLESMIYKFLNATTFDGYNPYRITKDGFDWETIEPDNPWSYIGYWGDHQIIYLLKLLELLEAHYPGKINAYFGQEEFVYANVPYRIKSYGDIVKDPKETIDFDHELDKRINELRKVLGADATLMHDEDQQIYTVNFVEKILAMLLAKISNFIPEGGIWMNTQRPEWNDANNALVGNGVSVVTLCYLRRFLNFFTGLLERSDLERFEMSNELIVAYKRIREAFESNQSLLDGPISDADRKRLLDEIGQAASDYRQHIYRRTFWGEKRSISRSGLQRFVTSTLNFVDHTIASNKRPDELYHAYNLMTVTDDDTVSISRLSEMLEGQVAVLSSGYLNPEQALAVLNGLKHSALFRDDQYSYLLYPNKDLPGFLARNTIPEKAVAESPLLARLVHAGNTDIITCDVNGVYHFNGNFKNADDLREALEHLPEEPYEALVHRDMKRVLNVFEAVFNHKAFTGRSGTFFGYEGLGSIYWHMVSKLRLAVQECALEAIGEGASEETIGHLLEHYYEISAGIGVHKPPSLYGAFPTDPYSHTPAGKGAQQPGMTGQVKEDILCRFGELGVFVSDGHIHFNPCLLRKDEFLREDKAFEFVNLKGEHEVLTLSTGSLGFTYCQIPVIYLLDSRDRLEAVHRDGRAISFEGLHLDAETSTQVFSRSGEVKQIIVHVSEAQLK